MREACPCYINRQDVVNARCIAGVIAHKVADTQEDDEKLGDEDMAAVAECLDLVARRRQLMQEEATRCWMATPHLPETAFQVLELGELYLPIDNVEYSNPDSDCTTGGYTDRALLNYNRTYAELFDWKFGFWAVEEAENNVQGICYTLGLFRKFPSLNSIRFFFKQPHLELVTNHLFERKDIPRLYLRVLAIVERARKAKLESDKGDFSMANPCVPACLFCGNLARCTKVGEMIITIGKKFMPLSVPDDLTPNKIQNPENSSKILNLAAVATAWAKASRSTITERVIRGEPPPSNHHLQLMPGRRSIIDMKLFREEALKYMTLAEYEGTLEATFGKVEDIIIEHSPRGSKESTVKEFQAALESSGAVERGPGYAFLRVEGGKKQTDKQKTE